MKINVLITSILWILFTTSCIREEALHAEADILSCTLPGVTLTTRPIIDNDAISLFVEKGTNIAQLAPEFTLTPGATIEPPSGTIRNFDLPQYYVVTAADGVWKKTYSISVIDSELGTRYDFEDTLPGQKYYIFVERSNGKVVMQWASGNPGYALTGVPKSADDYPTLQTANGTSNRCLELVTRTTGFFGAAMGMPIAAGNLFIGSFDVLIATSKPLEATRFGLPFYHVPIFLTGYYKYRSGSQFTVGGVLVPGRRDIGDIYALFYETTETVSTLNGTNAFTSPNLISVARITNARETEEWTNFNIPFLARPGKLVDKDKLRAGKYNIAIVFSSSLEGDRFNGAIGSTLLIDEVELVYSSEN